MNTINCDVHLKESFILKKYENGILYEVLLIENDNIKEVITDKEKLNAFN